MAASAPAQGVATTGAIERLTEEVRGLRTDIGQLVQGLTLLAEAQGAQGEMVRQILEAATREAPAENPMEGLIRELTTALGGMQASSDRVERTVGGLSQRLATATLRGVAPEPTEE